MNAVERLAGLQAENLPVMTARDVYGAEAEALFSDAQLAVLDEYFCIFTPAPTDADGREVCVCCGGRGVEWGLAHGEAFCMHCDWPHRVYHRDIGGKGDDAVVKFLSRALAYHPSGLRPPATEEDK